MRCSSDIINLTTKELQTLLQMYNNIANGQQQPLQFDAEGFPIGKCHKKAMTKVRADLSGNGYNRGILIINTQTNQERWVSMPADNLTAQAQNGTPLYFYGKGQRPSLVLFSQHQANIVSGGQYNADYYSQASQPQQSIYDNIEQDLYNSRPNGYQPEISMNAGASSLRSVDQYNQSIPQQSPQQVEPSNNSVDNETINDAVVEKACVIMSNAHNMLKSMLPNVSDEEITKIAISIYISRSKSDIPF